MEKGALLQPGFRGQQHRIDQPQGHIHVGKGHNSPFTYIYIPEVSTTLRFWGRLQNTSFLGTFDTFWGRFMQKRPFIFQAGAGYIH